MATGLPHPAITADWPEKATDIRAPIVCRGYNGRIPQMCEEGDMSFTRIPYTEEQKRKDEEHLKDLEFFNKNSRELMKEYPEQ